MSDEYKSAQARLMLEQASDVDIIVTTALIPGRKAPVLVTQEMLNVMKAGSVIVDLAASNGGNCESSVPGMYVCLYMNRFFRKISSPNQLCTKLSPV